MEENTSKTTGANPPLVFLSSASGGDETARKLFSNLWTAVESDRINLYDAEASLASLYPSPSTEQLSEFEGALQTAKVAVLCISSEYLGQQWLLEKETFRLLERTHKGDLALFPILSNPCSWRKIDWLADLQMFPADGKSIEEHSPQEQYQLIQRAADLIVKVATDKAKSRSKSETDDQNQSIKISDALSNYPMSTQAKVICDHARKMALISGDSVLSIEDLFFAIVETGRTSTLVSATQFLWKIVVARDEGNPYVEYLHNKFPNAAYSSTDSIVNYETITDRAEYVSPSALSIFKKAAKVSIATLAEQWKSSIDSDPPIHSRHIVAALLTPADEERAEVDDLLSKLGIDELQLRKDYYDFIAKECPNDNLEAWLKLLELDNRQSQIAAETGKEPDVLESRLAGFSADNWDKDDLLDITRDVEAFASLVAAARVDPPLSIGLFGDWGSGKSHFMKMLKSRVQKLASDTREARLKNNGSTLTPAYHENIVQIEFNAWHYIEGNLWASLVEHIFDNLRFSDHEKKDLVEERRSVLMEQLEIKKQIQAKVDERKGQLEVKKREAENRAADAKVQREEKSQVLQQLKDDLVSSALNEIVQPIEFSGQQKELLKQIGVSEDDLKTPAELRKQYDEIKTVGGRVRAQLEIFRKDPARLRKILLIVIGIAVAAAVKWVTASLIAGVTAYVAPIVTFIFSLIVAIKPYWTKIQEGLEFLEEKSKEIENQRKRRITELESEVTVLTKQYLDAQREAETINRQVGDLEAELACTTSSKLLAEFIEDRASAGDYRRHLGMLALVRRDFEKLSDFFIQQRIEQSSGSVVINEKTINRIILYIDDLDRCPPERVVQVLQAIHLLLAFPLFVVVVGVDARWVSRSLQESYEWLRAEDEEDEEEDQKEAKERNHNKGRVATPHDYLEKIFQIPFWLRPMEESTCRTLIDGLTRDLVEARQSADKSANPNPEDRRNQDTAQNMEHTSDSRTQDRQTPRTGTTKTNSFEESPGDGDSDRTEPNRESKIDEQPKEDSNEKENTDQNKNKESEGDKIDLSPENLKFTEEEVRFMKELAPLLGRSPRSVKRFLNCYRLIKVGLTKKELKTFLGEKGESDQFKGVIILLAIITGAPAASMHIMDVLGDWHKEKLANPEGATKSIPDLVSALDAKSELISQSDWLRVKAFLQNGIEADKYAATAEAMIRFVPRVSRYSFRVTRVGSAWQTRRDSRKSAQTAKSAVA